MSMDSSLQTIPPQATAWRRTHFAMLGFLMGIAVSAAIGAVLYIYLAVD
jgi:hypothetical protein